ncbi:MAG: ABC transporter ATP-binding protein [bacterium]|nr:ABC transporter ATP-binding protein [bacterium]
MAAPAGGGIVARDVSKRFGATQALDGVSFSAARGAITGLVGENGAGKSTLMRIVAGLEHADDGAVLVDGEALRPGSPSAAIGRGIGMVHQNFMLFEDLTVTENIIFGAETTSFGRLDGRAADERIGAIMDATALRLSTRATVGELSVADRQQVELLKILYRGAEMLILDEPTAVLTPQEADELFAVLDDLSRQGRGIVLITHRLREVMAVTGTVTVLRSGRVVGTSRTAGTDVEALAEMMVGRSPRRRRPAEPPTTAAPVLRVEDLRTAGRGGDALNGVTFSVSQGEIVGIAGVTGNGQSHVAEALLGLRPVLGGRIEIGGRDVTALPTPQRRALGLAYVPEDRFIRGLAHDQSISNNTALGHISQQELHRGPWLDRSAIKAWAATIVSRYDVRGGGPRAGDLSGGNAQRLLVGRELEKSGDLVVVEQPTRGVDVGAIEQIHAFFEMRREAGSALLLVSADLDEILQLSQRILVLYRGRIAAELPAGADRYRVGLAMAGLDGPEPAAP